MAERDAVRSQNRAGSETELQQAPVRKRAQEINRGYDMPRNIIENYLEDNIIVSGLRNQIVIVHIPNMLPESFR